VGAAARSEWSRAVAESLLPSNKDDRFSAVLIVLDRDGRTGPMRPRTGGLQFAYCLRGRVGVVVGGEESYELSRGDSMMLQHDRALEWENAGTGSAEVMLVTARLA
jgi:quercetin dioxygenase-like cupin family protein